MNTTAHEGSPTGQSGIADQIFTRVPLASDIGRLDTGNPFRVAIPGQAELVVLPRWLLDRASAQFQSGLGVNTLVRLPNIHGLVFGLNIDPQELVQIVPQLTSSSALSGELQGLMESECTKAGVEPGSQDPIGDYREKVADPAVRSSNGISDTVLGPKTDVIIFNPEKPTDLGHAVKVQFESLLSHLSTLSNPQGAGTTGK
jgi:hypothetical protein